jgi:hypothetical protein
MVKFVLLPLALALCLALPVRPVFAAVDPDDLVRESVDRLGLQTDLPRPTSAPLTQAPGAPSQPQAEMSAPKSEPQAQTPNPAGAAPDDRSDVAPGLLRFLLWGAVIVGTAVIVWSLRDSLPVVSRSRKIIAAEPVLPSPTQSNRMEEAQLEADDLARQGRYDQAMHVLLLKSLNEIHRQLGTSFAVSLTSREILRRVQLPEIGRRSLTSIIRSVERTYFGAEAAGQRDYSDCRTHFETLKYSLAARDAA